MAFCSQWCLCFLSWPKETAFLSVCKSRHPTRIYESAWSRIKITEMARILADSRIVMQLGAVNPLLLLRVFHHPIKLEKLGSTKAEVSGHFLIRNLHQATKLLLLFSIEIFPLFVYIVIISVDATISRFAEMKSLFFPSRLEKNTKSWAFNGPLCARFKKWQQQLL